MSPSTFVHRASSWTALDFRPDHEQPTWSLVAFATVTPLVGSLVADAILVAIGTRVFPSTKVYVHFPFSDYPKLTVIGVLVACAGWPVITRVSPNPRRLSLLLAIGTTVVLFALDIWILWNVAPAKAVAIVMVMHVAMAVVTCLSVLLAPARRNAANPDFRAERAA